MGDTSRVDKIYLQEESQQDSLTPEINKPKSPESLGTLQPITVITLEQFLSE